MTIFRDAGRTPARRRLVSGVLLAPLLLTVACSSSTGPGGPVTVLVVNETCEPGPCVPLRVFGFPAPQPRTPGGVWGFELGYVWGPVACFRLPASGELRGANADTGATATYAWTLEDPLAFGALPGYSSMSMGRPGTEEFVPTRSEGWIVSLPSGTTVMPDVACTPPGALD